VRDPPRLERRLHRDSRPHVHRPGHRGRHNNARSRHVTEIRVPRGPLQARSSSVSASGGPAASPHRMPTGTCQWFPSGTVRAGGPPWVAGDHIPAAMDKSFGLFGCGPVGTGVVVRHRDQPAASLLVVDELASRANRLIVRWIGRMLVHQVAYDLAPGGPVVESKEIEPVAELPEAHPSPWYARWPEGHDGPVCRT
jgi:hypothetical protein